jgi:hypothetical protein
MASHRIAASLAHDAGLRSARRVVFRLPLGPLLCARTIERACRHYHVRPIARHARIGRRALNLGQHRHVCVTLDRVAFLGRLAVTFGAPGFRSARAFVIRTGADRFDGLTVRCHHLAPATRRRRAAMHALSRVGRSTARRSARWRQEATVSVMVSLLSGVPHPYSLI